MTLVSRCGSLCRDIREVARPCIWLWHPRRKRACDVKRLTFDFVHTGSLSLLCLRRNSKHFSGSDTLFCQVLTQSCWQNTFSQKLKSFCQGNLFCSIILLVDKCSRGKQNLQLFWECSARYLQVYLFCRGKEWLLVCRWTIQVLM